MRAWECGQTCLALGEKQLYAAAGTTVHDRVVFSLLVIAQVIERRRWGSRRLWRGKLRGGGRHDTGLVCVVEKRSPSTTAVKAVNKLVVVEVVTTSCKVINDVCKSCECGTSYLRAARGIIEIEWHVAEGAEARGLAADDESLSRRVGLMSAFSACGLEPLNII